MWNLVRDFLLSLLNQQSKYVHEFTTLKKETAVCFEVICEGENYGLCLLKSVLNSSGTYEFTTTSTSTSPLVTTRYKSSLDSTSRAAYTSSYSSSTTSYWQTFTRVLHYLVGQKAAETEIQTETVTYVNLFEVPCKTGYESLCTQYVRFLKHSKRYDYLILQFPV